MAAAALSISIATAAAPYKHYTPVRLAPRAEASQVFKSERQKSIDNAVSRMEKGKPSRFANTLTAPTPDGGYAPDYIFDVKDTFGDIDGPDGELWYYQGNIEYETINYEFYSEELPKSFELSVYDSDMQLVGTIKDTFVLKEDELRVRQVDFLPILTKNYFNSDDAYEVVISIVVNPKPYGLRSYSYVYQFDGAKDASGDDEPIRVINGLISDVLDASDESGENVLMTFMNEHNDSGIDEEDTFTMVVPDGNGWSSLTEEEKAEILAKREKFWQYQLGNKVDTKIYGAVDENGEFTLLFDKTSVYYQCNGNQQDDPLIMTMLNGDKPVLVYPYYENTVYEPFYSNMDDMTQRQPNNLVIELYQQSEPGKEFELIQSTKIPVIKVTDDDVLCSYYGIGGFSYRDDVAFVDGKAQFIITRRDYIASSDSEILSFFTYDSDGKLIASLFENSDSHTRLSDIDGFDPMEVFVTYENGAYYFNFFNMRTFTTELRLNYGLRLDDYEDSDPDYMMANLDRTPTADGKSFMYVAEMRQPGYDDIHDINYMRVVWLNRDGSFDHFDNINMGNNVNYASLFLNGPTLQKDFFHSDDKQEYMMLIKRATPENPDKATEEQLLIAQVVDKDNPVGKDLLLLGECESGALLSIYPIYGKQNRLSITYGTEGSTIGATTHYYNLPLDLATSGVEDVVSDGANDIIVNGSLVSAPGHIEVYNVQGVLVATGTDSVDLGGMARGIYIARTANASAKVAVR